MLSAWISRPLAFDALAHVYTKPPTTVAGLFRQRLRWNSSRMQDIKRWSPSLRLSMADRGVGDRVVSDCHHVSRALRLRARFRPLEMPPGRSPWSLCPRWRRLQRPCCDLVDSVVALLVSECPLSHWVFLLSLPAAGYYHVAFNTITWIVGTTPGRLRSRTTDDIRAGDDGSSERSLSRFALAYRVRRGFPPRVPGRSSSAIVPLGAFSGLGWRETPWDAERVRRVDDGERALPRLLARSAQGGLRPPISAWSGGARWLNRGR